MYFSMIYIETNLIFYIILGQSTPLKNTKKHCIQSLQNEHSLNNFESWNLQIKSKSPNISISDVPVES